MCPWSALGKFFLIIGVVFCLVGLGLLFLPRLPFNLGHLPGDVVFERPGLKVYFPWVTCLVVSIVLTLILSLFNR